MTHDSKVLSTIAVSFQILDSRYNYLSWCIDCFEFYSKKDYIYSSSCHCLYKTYLQSFVSWKIVLHVASSCSSRNNPIKVCKLCLGGQEKEIYITKILVFSTDKTGGVEVMGHGSPVQWQSIILVSLLCSRRGFPFGNEMQEPAIGKKLVLTLSLHHNIEVKENFKPHGSSENLPFLGASQ